MNYMVKNIALLRWLTKKWNILWILLWYVQCYSSVSNVRSVTDSNT